jgi:hypothetical protein
MGKEEYEKLKTSGIITGRRGAPPSDRKGIVHWGLATNPNGRSRRIDTRTLFLHGAPSGEPGVPTLEGDRRHLRGMENQRPEGMTTPPTKPLEGK